MPTNSPLEEKLGLEFKDKSLLNTALVHRSYVNEVSADIEHNERLEFLGDAVLELIVTEYLFNKYKDRPEGELTSFRAATVKTESLAATANELDLGKYIFLSKGEEITGGREKPYILANTYEAILGAVYLDSGYNSAKQFVENTLISKIESIVKYRLDIDSKSKLQELAQEIVNFTPSYELVKAEGPDHNKKFTMQIIIDGVLFGSGEGKSKQEAEQKAAKFALENWEELLEKYKKNKA